MTCPQARDEFWLWALGEYDGDEADAFAAHTRECANCALRAEEIRGFGQSLAHLAEVPAPAAPNKSTLPPKLQPPRSFGDYEIGEELGRGGMGIVYSATHIPTQRVVALKVTRGRALDADDIAYRLFQRETQVLARLQHPNIATLYDAGITPDGQPYYAMERVDGRPLLDFANRAASPLTLIQRVALMHTIADAVAHAHQRGVIHRDLKPSNILITPDGAAKILDFGLGRLLEPDPTGSQQLTEGAQVVGTLPYMSPEQARGESDRIDVRTDVYALGVMLYELFTGQYPVDVFGVSQFEAVRRISETAPPAVRSLNPRVARDVETITHKALAKELDQRYPSAAALADDLRRFLTHHPIQARRQSAAYRFRKLVARHTLAVSLVGAIIIILAISAAVFLRQRDIARDALAKAQQFNTILTDYLAHADPWQQSLKGRATRVVDVLDAIAAGVDEELANRPLLAADVRHMLGNTYFAFGDYEPAERELRATIALRAVRLGDEAADTVEARCDLAELLFEAGRIDEAEPLMRDGLRARQARYGPQDPLIAESLNSLGVLAKRRGELDHATALLRQSLAIRERRVGETPSTGDHPRAERNAALADLAQTQNNLASVLRQRALEHRDAGDEAAAQAAFDEAYALYRSAFELREAALPPDHPDIAKMLNNIGKLLHDTGRLAEAEDYLRRSLAILDEKLGPQHSWSARGRYNLALVIADEGRPTEAHALAQEALEVQQRMLPADAPDITRTRELLAALPMD